MQDKTLFSSNNGGVLILIAVILPLLMMATGIAVDIGRIFATEAKAQNAMDAALLGAVSTRDNPETPLNSEVGNIFNANYPPHYMGSVVSNFAVGSAQCGIYTSDADVTIPNIIMSLFKKPNTIVHIHSEVSGGFCGSSQELEVAMVLDNSGSMTDIVSNGQPKIVALREAANDLVDILFGNNPSLPNVHISLVPFNTSIRMNWPYDNWIQSNDLPVQYQSVYAKTIFDRYSLYKGIRAAKGGYDAYLSNRNSDDPPNGYSDYSDDPPTSEDTRFRVAYAWGYPYDCYTGYCKTDPYNPPSGSLQPADAIPDTVAEYLNAITFATNNKSTLHLYNSWMQAAGGTRINVGLMWGMFMLSPKWQGLWGVYYQPGDPTLPRNYGQNNHKAIVLMTDGRNEAGYDGTGGKSDDDTTTAQLCEVIKDKGIVLYTIGFGNTGDVNEPLLRNCATSPANYYLAPTNEQLKSAFHQIGDDILYNTVHLTH